MVDDISQCPVMQEGQVLYTDYSKLDDFCEGAWKAIESYVLEMADGVGSDWYSKEWIKIPGVAIVSCNDGLRPVIMKVEANQVNNVEVME